MTPRTVSSSTINKDFSRQVSEHKNDLPNPHKKFRFSAAPKGTKLPAGYIDRTKLRHEDPETLTEEGGSKHSAAGENKNNLGINVATLSQSKDDFTTKNITLGKANPVKGLDWELLEKVKKGEIDTSDVLEYYLCKDDDSKTKNTESELEKHEKMEVKAITHEKIKKKGEMAPPARISQKRTRDQILAELKAVREASSNLAPPKLGSKFKKFGETRTERKIIRDAKGREILIITDEKGNEKRKVRKIMSEDQKYDKKNDLLIPDKDLKPLGMVVPDLHKASDLEEDMDIFDDVGDDYNPLAGLESSNSSDEEGEETKENKKTKNSSEETLGNADSESLTKRKNLSPQHSSQQELRNYFQTPLSDKLPKEANAGSKPLALSDPTILAALKKASEISLKATKLSSSENHTENSDESLAALHTKEERYKRMLQRDDRDALDLDLGFGSSRVEDDNDADEGALKFSDWGKSKKKKIK
ncbi:putative inosine-uridine preferring nucleoside hydrolase [Erysiphe necator]|uniref:Putative inosine-uridine preferring nucleoside hydrolase n=1 Tax=Uncinula necator TaxID=52586 RepID=A0A0B1PEL1_UNCNE|nr:putative inosine-uridine preferring nucleoside hydrolase [Erysiphe necator]